MEIDSGHIDLADVQKTILEMEQDRMGHMEALGIVLRLIELNPGDYSIKELCSILIDILAEETSFENISLLLYDPRREVLKLAAAKGLHQVFSETRDDSKYNKDLYFRRGKSIAWSVFDSQQPLFIEDSSADRIPQVENAKFVPASLACLPISSKGVLNLSSSRKREFPNHLRRNLIIITQVMGHILQEKQFHELLNNSHYHIQNIVDANTRAIAQRGDDSRQSIEYLEAAIDSAPQGICLTNAAGEITKINRSLKKLLECGEDIIEKEGLGRFFFDATAFLSLSKAIKAEHLAKFSGVRLLRPDGSTFLADIFFHPIIDKNGTKQGGIIVIHDISDQHRDSERKIREEKLRALGSMAAGIAHDFNNLLMAILGNVELLQLDLADTSHAKRLNNIELCVQDGAKTIKRLQSFVGHTSPPKTEGVQTTRVAQIISEAIELTKPMWKDSCQKKGCLIQIETDLDESVHAQIPGYELREILTNLILNAVDAMQKGGTIRLSTYLRDSMAVIEISDNGAGMDKDTQKHIFDPYFTTKDVGSSGLGLSIVYGLITNAGGGIEVESDPGYGTTFVITLPSPSSQKENQAVTRNKIQDSRKEGLKILAIDDEIQIVELIQLMLKEAGHEVISCSDSEKALEMIKNQDFDLVLTDLGMPGISGWEIARAVKEKNASIPVVLMTGWGAGYEGKDLSDKCVDEVISKPFRLQNILDVLTRLFPKT